MLNIEVSTPLLIIISVSILLLIIACIAFIIYKDKKADSKEIDDLLDDLVKSKPRKNSSLINSQIEVPIGENKEIIEVINEPKKIDLETMLNKMQENLSTKEQVVENFEHEQEEKAIISYQELLENMDKDTFKEDIDKHEYEQEKTFEEQTKEKVKEFLTKESSLKKVETSSDKKTKKFKNTDFISPIFGKMNVDIEYPRVKLFETKKDILDEIEDYKHAKTDYINDLNKNPYEEQTIINETIDIKPIEVETSRNDEFLKSLKEFRNNL